MSEMLTVTRDVAISADELEWRFTSSGGPGGQHANTANTRVEVAFDIEGSASLDDDTRARLHERFGASVTAVAADERSQHQNRRLAVERLLGKLASALYVPTPRRPTKPSAGAKRRRRAEKRRRADLKKLRRKPRPD